MPSILVLEQDPRSLERIHHTLGAAGWRVRVVGEPAEAFQAATSERPDLVIVGAALSGAASVAGSFSRRTGGPGVLGLLPGGMGPDGFGGLGADELLPQPFSDQELLAAVRRAGTAPKAATAAAARPQVESKLTSLDIFGDVLAEVELADDEPAAAPAPAAAAPRPAPQRPPMDDDLNRKLEMTLSGVLGSDLGKPRPAAPAAAPPAGPAAPPVVAPAAAAKPVAPAPAPPRPAAPPPRKPDPAGDDDIDAILSRTLGEVGRPRPAAPRPAPPAAPAPPSPPPPPPVSTTAPPAEGTAVRKAPRSDGGLSQLEELTRTFRTPSGPAPAAAPPPRPAVPAPPAPAAFTPPVPSPPPPAPVFEPPPAVVPPVAVAPPPPVDPPSVSLFGADPFDLTALELPPPPEPEPEPEPILEAEPEPILEAEPEPVVEAEPEPVVEAVADDAPFDLVDLEIEPEPEPLPEPPRPAVAEGPGPVPAGVGVFGGGVSDVAATQRISVVLDDGTLNVPGAERFGQYTLLEKIAAGGMAEVWKARMRGVEGFQKTVAIKKILPHMTDNSEFIGMFIDEAKLAAQLSHPNIVHIYDLGKIGRDYYIAMEYVEGKDLRSLLNASRRKRVPISLGLALLIASRLASALDYAHRKRDFEGKELGLVHRDVSPQNVLLTHEGDVKLCDFGIAKAVSKAGQTQMGSLKGKLQYMSPEQAWGRPVDSRSDIFSLGTVLFEMLTGERLFSGESEMSVLEAVRHGRIRTPREIDPSIPAEVDEIVTRALAYDVRDRFQSAGEMMQRIDAVLHTLVPSPGPGELAAYLQRVLAPEPSSDVMFIPPPASPPPAPPPPAPAAVPVRLPDPEVPPSLFAPEPSPPPPAEAVPVEAVAPVGDVRVEEPGSRKSRLVLVAAIVVVLLLGAILTFFFLRGRRDAEPVPPPPVTAPAAQPAPAQTAPPAPATEAPAPAAEQVDLQAIVKEEVEKRTKKRQREYEEELRRLEREVEKAKKAQAQDTAEGQKPPSQEPPPERD